MIERIRGKILDKTPTCVVIDWGGMGIAVGIPLSTSQEIGDVGDEALLYTQLVIREHSWELYGFSKEEEREVFNTLTSVSGIGPKAALNLLSRMEMNEIKTIIAESRTDILTSVPGIGKKKAAKIIFELNAKMAREPVAADVPVDALKALVALGLSKREAAERLRKVGSFAQLSLSEILKRALKGER